MEQKELREIEDRCIQEQPAFCVAACPIHVDVRTFMARMREGKWDEARKILNKTMPFAGILGRICDHPCQNLCKRGEAGDPLAIGELERFCVSQAPTLTKISFLPSRAEKIAILTAGLHSLTVAWDLIRKGYKIHIFTDKNFLGEYLREFPEAVLPGDVIDRELSIIEKIGAVIHLNAAAEMERIKTSAQTDEFAAVYIPPETYFTQSHPFSPITEVMEGRIAAVTLDRRIQNVSLTAGREKEGPYATRLFTAIDDVVPLPQIPVTYPETGFSMEDAVKEAKRCLQCQCLECVKACLYLERFKGYPKKYAREIYNNESIVMGERKSNTLVNSCSLCGQCEVICPNDFSMAALCLSARQSMVKRGKMPPSAHEFALMDMDFSNGKNFALTKNAPGHEKSAYVFFPGCQLCASLPHHVGKVYELLLKGFSGGVGLMLGCCGAPAKWSGREEIFQNGIEIILAEWESLGAPQIITACTSCYAVFKTHLPQVNIMSLWEVLSIVHDFSALETPKEKRFALHDPCTARHEKEIRQYVRELLHKTGYDIESLKYSGELTTCCGFGGLMLNANQELAKDVMRKRAGESKADFVTYCAMCRDGLASVGKRAVHVLDLLFPGDYSGQTPEKPPTWSQRRENRARLKENLMRTFWKEEVLELPDEVSVHLNIPPEIEARLDERRILITDVYKVINYSETTGNCFTNPATGHRLSSFKPVNVTYWVEYSKTEKGFTVHNAYCHRMTIAGEEK